MVYFLLVFLHLSVQLFVAIVHLKSLGIMNNDYTEPPTYDSLVTLDDGTRCYESFSSVGLNIDGESKRHLIYLN